MSEFTREELLHLMKMVGSISVIDRLVIDHELLAKLKSMIDNYCEHESDGNRYTSGV